MHRGECFFKAEGFRGDKDCYWANQSMYGDGKGAKDFSEQTVSLPFFSLQVRVYFATLHICFSLYALVSIKYPSLSFQVRLFKVHKYMNASFIKEWNRCFHLMDLIPHRKHLFSIFMKIAINLYVLPTSKFIFYGICGREYCSMWFYASRIIMFLIYGRM